MKRTSLLWIWGAVGAGATCALSISACQAVAKLESRTADPLPGACGADAGTLPSGAFRMRLANLTPSAAMTDFCIRPSGAGWGRPLLRNGSATGLCNVGLTYEQVTVPFGEASGKVDVKAIPFGQTCSAAGTSELDGIALPGDGSVMTVARIGGDGVAEKIVSLVEDTAPDVSDARLRLVNAINGVDAITLGVTDGATLPQDVSSALYPSPIPFGGIEPAGQVGPGSIDANGYLVTLPSGLNFGIVPPDQTKAIIAFSLVNEVTESVYAIGSANDPAFPVIGLVCDENSVDPTNALLASCHETALPTLHFVTFNVSLYGANAPLEDQRRAPLRNAIAASDADAMCVLEAGDKVDRDGIATAAQQGNLKFAYAPTMDLTTPPTDPTDWNHNTPPPLTTPPCGGSLDPSVVSAAWQCMIDNCNTTPGNPAGTINGSTSCLSTKCTREFLPLDQSTKPPQLFCFECMVYNVATNQTYADSQNNCDNSTLRPLGFEGQNPSMILSRFPFAKKSDGSDDVEAYVLPTTGFRRSVLRAKLQIDPKSTIDFYCAQLSSPYIQASVPYDGAYAHGGTNGWEDEQDLQAQRVVSFVQSRSGSGPAVIAGDWHASRANTPPPGQQLAEQSPEVLDTLEAAFKLVHAKDWVPQCTYCTPPADPYDALSVGQDLHSTYVYNLAPTATKETLLYVPDYNDPSTYITFTPDPNNPNAPTRGPISEYFARSIHIERP